MRSRAETGLALFLALGVFLGGCSSAPQTKTILLPEREARETGAEETEGQSYAVRKIYSREIEDGLSWAPEIYLDGEHSFRWWTERPAENSMESGKMVLAEVSMDYRYGFYEERLLPLEAEALGSMPLLRETAEQKQYETETGCDPVSPDGKYAVYIDSAHTHTGDRLYLLDMDTGEKTLLLDGDVLNCSGEEYRILTAWSADSEVLCYGFCMRELTEESLRFAGEGNVLHFLRLSSGEHTMMSGLSWHEGMELGELGQVHLYTDWKDGRLRAVLVYQFAQGEQGTPEEEEVYHVQFVFADGTDGENGADFFGWPPVVEILTDTVYGELPVYLDAEQDRAYIAREGRIHVYDGTGDPVETIDCGEDKEILDFLVLDEGDTLVTAEKAAQNLWTEICLYQRSGEGFAHQILYVGGGYVYCMEYDPAGRRLLIDASNGIEERELSYYTWQGIVLEFE